MLKSVTRRVAGIPSYIYRNFAAPRIYSIRDRKILARNLKIKDKYAGKRCFIVAGGPSVADLDLSKLKNEQTFVVNEFEKNPQYASLAPKFHLIVESNYFSKTGPEYWRHRFIEKSRDIPASTTMIVNLGAKPVIEENNLFKDHRVYYLGTQGIFSEYFPFNISLDKYVPNPKNSVMACLLAATWMGFREIILLGCEHSFLAQPVSANKSLAWGHGYKDAVSGLQNADAFTLRKYITEKEMGFNYEADMVSMVQLFRNYRYFLAKAKQLYPGLAILNATPNSFLDVFPMIKFEDIKI